MRSAPRNGMPFLAWGIGEDDEPHMAVVYISTDRTLCFDTGGFADESGWTPTKWMALPEPPP